MEKKALRAVLFGECASLTRALRAFFGSVLVLVSSLTCSVFLSDPRVYHGNSEFSEGRGINLLRIYFRLHCWRN